MNNVMLLGNHQSSGRKQTNKEECRFYLQVEYHHYPQRHPICLLDDRLARLSTYISEVIAAQASINLDTLIRL
jgi:hypothetical protein